MATQPAELLASPIVEKRQADVSTHLLLNEVLRMLHNMDSKLSTHIEDETEQFNTFFNKAFPGADPGSHKMWHETEIRRIEAKAKLYESLRTELMKWGLIAFIGFAALAIWHKVGDSLK